MIHPVSTISGTAISTGTLGFCFLLSLVLFEVIKSLAYLIESVVLLASFVKHQEIPILASTQHPGPDTIFSLTITEAKYRLTKQYRKPNSALLDTLSRGIKVKAPKGASNTE